MNIDVSFEVVETEYGMVAFRETMESALSRVSKVFGFNFKDMEPINTDNATDGDDIDKWCNTYGIWHEGFFKINNINYHFRFDIYDGFKPSLWTE